MKKYLFVIIIVLVKFFAFAQDTSVNWLSFEQVGKKYVEKPKPIFLYTYLSHDSLSELMLDSNLNSAEVASYINFLFYPIKMDIESEDTIVFFNGQKFIHKANEKYHSLAKLLLGDSIESPSIVLFDKKAQGRAFYGFKNRNELFPILIYYSEEVYNSVRYDIWEKYYFKTYPPGQKQIITHLNIHWMKMSEMLEKQKTQPRKIFIDIYNNYNVSQTIMRLQVYNNPEIAKYMNKYFYSVTIPMKSEEEFEIKGITYKNSGSPLNYHQFAIAVLNGVMKFPAFIILDEDFNMLDRIQVFRTVEQFSKICHYYGNNEYKLKN